MSSPVSRASPALSWPVRFLDEILLSSGQYALFYILMNFADHVDGRVRDRIISADGRLGEEKDVAVLFSDIRDFTSLTESAPAEAVVEMLNEFFSEWDRVCSAHRGIIDKFIGDAVMILFEAHQGAEPAQDAVRCGLAMVDGWAGLRTRLAERALPAPRGIGIGISRGPVILGNIGSERRRNYTAVGDTVNTASRLESACKTFDRRLIVSEAVHRALEPSLASLFTCLGEIPLKGKSGSVRAFGA